MAESKRVRLSKVIAECGDHLGLKVVRESVTLDVPVGSSDIGRPGLLLSGFTGGFVRGQIQVIGAQEVEFLESLAPEERIDRFRSLIGRDIPCVVVAGGLSLPDDLVDICENARIPVLCASATPSEVVQRLNSWLLVNLAPEQSLNGTLVDVHGVGILLTGKSGIGKSECALALVSRGHRLVADDLVKTVAVPPGVLIGRSSQALQSYVEVRGIGLVDIGSIFGIRALRRQKRIEIVVDLKEWQEGDSYDRSGLECSSAKIMGIKIPSMTVPLVPGKSVSVIVEVIALGHILRIYGYDAAGTLNERWLEHVRARGKSDFEARDVE